MTGYNLDSLKNGLYETDNLIWRTAFATTTFLFMLFLSVSDAMHHDDSRQVLDTGHVRIRFRPFGDGVIHDDRGRVR